MSAYSRWVGGFLGTVAGMALLGLGVAGCNRSNSGAGAGGDGAVATAPGERSFPLTGEVVAVDAKHKQLTVRHNAVEGYMPGMTMEFAVAAGDAAAAHVGEKIRAALIVDAHGNARLEQIWPDDKVSLDTIDAGVRVLREDTHDRGGSAYREVGEVIPDFALYDENGRVVEAGRFRGKQIVLNFIYTRCPVASMCPAATLKMVATQKLARKAGVANVEFVSITLDPKHDTPGVLRAYADDRGIDTSNFSFLTGPEGAIRDLLTQFGVIAEFDGDLIKHTLATLVIDERGHIAFREDGSAWEPSEVMAHLHRGS
jgi:protein SCO1/2